MRLERWISASLVVASMALTVLVAIDRLDARLLLLAVAAMVAGVAVAVYGSREL